MTLRLLRLGVDADASARIAVRLARECDEAYREHRDEPTGVGPASCWAALAVAADQGFGPTEGDADFGTVRANSQYARIRNRFRPIELPGLADPVSSHAERNCFAIAANERLAFHPADTDGSVTLFVQMHPCPPCERYLAGLADRSGSTAARGAAPVHDWLAAHPRADLLVWYMFPYDDQSEWTRWQATPDADRTTRLAAL